MMPELIRRVKFAYQTGRCGRQTGPDSRRRESDKAPAVYRWLNRQTSGREELANELPQGAER